MTSLAPIPPASASLSPFQLASNHLKRSADDHSEMRAAFQETVAGLLFGQMIKALRSGVGKPAYLHGGPAEDMFQAQMDQEVAESLAKSHGGMFIDNLYARFLIDHPERRPARPAELSPLTQAANSASAVESVQAATWSRSLTSGSGITSGTGVIPALNRK